MSNTASHTIECSRSEWGQIVKNLVKSGKSLAVSTIILALRENDNIYKENVDVTFPKDLAFLVQNELDSIAQISASE